MNRLLELDAYLDEVIEFGIGRTIRRGAAQVRKGAMKAVESQDAQTRHKIASHLKRRKAYTEGYKKIGRDHKKILGDKGSFVRGQLRQSERTGTIGAKTVGTLRGADRRIYKAGSKEGQKRVRQIITRKASGKAGISKKFAKKTAKEFKPAQRQEAIFQKGLKRQRQSGKRNAIKRSAAQDRAQRIAVQG
jgi:hypothetical protein